MTVLCPYSLATGKAAAAASRFIGVVDRHSSRMAAKNLHWQTSMPGQEVTCAASLKLLGMTLRNLIDNAIRFTGPSGNIELCVRRDSETIVFELPDTRCGIAPQE